jgi:hypothetical protein
MGSSAKNNNALTFQLDYGGTNATKMTLDTSGNLGLGVTPSAWASGWKAFQIGTYGNFSALSNQINISTNAYYNSGSWFYQNTNPATNYAQVGGQHIWQNAPSNTSGNAITFTSAMTLDSSGGLRINTTSYIGNSGEKLTVTTSGDTSFFQSTGAGGAGTSIHANRNGSAGNFLYFTYGAGLSPVGSISTNGTITVYNTTSDYRLKNNQAPLTGSGAFIDALQPKTWNWTQDGSKGVGFIAHEFAEVSPSSVNGTKDAVDADGKPVYQAMQASSAEVIANLVAEIQSLRKRILTLENK